MPMSRRLLILGLPVLLSACFSGTRSDLPDLPFTQLDGSQHRTSGIDSIASFLKNHRTRRRSQWFARNGHPVATVKDGCLGWLSTDAQGRSQK